MQTKRDQLQAHNFVVGRLRSALLRHDPDAEETPTRRFTVAAAAGAVLGVLAVAGVAVFGLVVPGGNTGWRVEGAVLLEKETGTRYLYAEGVLRPVLNYASARLLSRDGQISSVSGNSLTGVGHGLPVGIPGAPDALPGPGHLVRAPWTVCSRASTGATPAVAVLVGNRTPPGPQVGEGLGVRVTTTAGQEYLVWHGLRLRVADRAAAVALRLDQVNPVKVADTWLNALPAAADLKAPEIAGRGARGPRVDGVATRVGQVLSVQQPGAGREEYLVVLGTGLVPVTPTIAALVLADPATRVAYPGRQALAVPVSPSGVTGVATSPVRLAQEGFPATAPELFDGARVEGGSLCVTVQPGSAEPAIRLSIGSGTWPTPDRAGPAGDPRAADLVLLPAGTGALVRARANSSTAGGTLFLITDWGLRFPIASVDAVARLGFRDVAPVEVPTSLLALVPQGPALDPASAARVATMPAAGS